MRIAPLLHPIARPRFPRNTPLLPHPLVPAQPRRQRHTGQKRIALRPTTTTMATSTTPTPDYTTWTQTALISHIRTLESQLQQHTTTTTTTTTSLPPPFKKPRKAPK